MVCETLGRRCWLHFEGFYNHNYDLMRVAFPIAILYDIKVSVNHKEKHVNIGAKCVVSFGSNFEATIARTYAERLQRLSWKTKKTATVQLIICFGSAILPSPLRSAAGVEAVGSMGEQYYSLVLIGISSLFYTLLRSM